MFCMKHSISTAIARQTAWDEGIPLAWCRVCGCYGSHKAAGLSRSCKGFAQKCRQHELRRLKRGLHPDRRSGLFLEDVRHYGRGKFSVQVRGASNPAEEPRSVMEAAQRAADVHDVDEGDVVLEELEAMEVAAERAAASLSHQLPPPAKRLRTGVGAEGQEEGEDGYEGDVFDFGHDMGPAAYSSDAETDEAPRNDEALPAATQGLPTSLAQMEERLAVLGEVPRFRPTEASYIEHRCSTIDATVRFWPSTLQWTTDGPQGDVAYDAVVGSATACRR